MSELSEKYPRWRSTLWAVYGLFKNGPKKYGESCVAAVAGDDIDEALSIAHKVTSGVWREYHKNFLGISKIAHTQTTQSSGRT